MALSPTLDPTIDPMALSPTLDPTIDPMALSPTLSPTPDPSASRSSSMEEIRISTDGTPEDLSERKGVELDSLSATAQDMSSTNDVVVSDNGDILVNHRRRTSQPLGDSQPLGEAGGVNDRRRTSQPFGGPQLLGERLK